MVSVNICTAFFPAMLNACLTFTFIASNLSERASLWVELFLLTIVLNTPDFVLLAVGYVT